MIAAYLTGLSTGIAIALIVAARRQARSNRDRAAVTAHLAMVRAMSSMSTPHRDHHR